MTTRTRVIIAGAGPVGVVAAYRLAQWGIDTIVLEAGADCPEDMRASTFHPPSLEMMSELGIFEELAAVGLKAPLYQYRNRATGNAVELDLSELADMTAHPYRLQCEQWKLSRLVSAKLAAHPHGDVRFQHRLVSIEQDASGVTVHAETPLAIESFRADYLIAADGASSTVRKWTGIEFEGFTYPERFLTLSTDYAIEQQIPNLANVNYVADAEEWCVLLRVPGLWRVLVPSAEVESDAFLTSDAKKNAVFRGLLGDDIDVQTYHRTLYRVHQRVAKSFRHGRVLLAGDAAHLNNPLGGFGMNSGLHDAWNLTEKLRRVLFEDADADVQLDHYDRQRRTVTRDFVQAQTIANKQMLEAEGAGGKTVQELKLEALVADPVARREYLLKQAMFRSLEDEAAIA